MSTMLFAFTSKAGTLSQFSLKACFFMEKNDLGFPPPQKNKNKIMHLGGEEMWSEFAIWACFYTLGEAEALG